MGCRPYFVNLDLKNETLEKAVTQFIFQTHGCLNITTVPITIKYVRECDGVYTCTVGGSR